MTMVQDSRAREQRPVDRYRGDDFTRGAGVEIDYMERRRHGGSRRAPGSGPPNVAGQPQGTPMIPVLRALLPPLPPPPLPPAAVPESPPGSVEPRYFPACPACQVDAEQGEEWIWFGSRGGCGQGMHPPCWRQYVTHCAISARGSLDEAGRSFDARGCLRVQCPTCRRAVTGEVDFSDSSGGRLVRVEQVERLVVPGSEPGDSSIFIPRMPRVAFPEHVDREDGRLRMPLVGAGAVGGNGHGVARAPSQAPAPAEPARARSPLPTRGDPSGPGHTMVRGSAADGGRTMDEGGRNDDGLLAAARRDGQGDRDAGARHSGSMRGPGWSHGGGSRGPLVHEQLGARLTRSGAAAIGQMVMRSMASDPGLRQLLFGGMAHEAMEVSSSRDDSPSETDGYISDGLRAMGLAAEGLLHHEQRELRGGDRRRGMDGARQAGRDGAWAGRQYCPLPHGEDGGSSGLFYAPAIRPGNTASGT